VCKGKKLGLNPADLEITTNPKPEDQTYEVHHKHRLSRERDQDQNEEALSFFRVRRAAKKANGQELSSAR
jgi:hypothetical protein